MIQVFSTPELLADGVARHVAECAEEAISKTGRFTVALSGGSTPEAAYRRLATGDFSHELDWGRTHVLWGDERSVPPDDPRSNYRMAKESLLDRVPIPAENVHRIRGEDQPEKAAAEYEREVRALCHPERSEGSLGRPPRDSRDPSLALRMTGGAADAPDLVLLGLGEDGHTASLFPGQPAVRESERWVVAVLDPDGELWRVTLTPPILNAAHNVAFVVSGGSKAAPLRQVLEGPFTPDLLPAQAIRPVHGRITWLTDEAAAGELRTQRAST
ncbi:MAG: 6-phosphogluconolactonase [Gemmatimonadales bacterium]